MTISFMRILDYWIGIPLCFLLSGVNWIGRFFTCRKKRETKESPKRILFIKLSEMGSLILCYPLIKSIRQDYPSAEIFFLTFEKNKPIFYVLNHIINEKNVLTINENCLLSFTRDVIRAIIFLRKKRFDIIYDLELFSRCTAIISYLCGSVKRIGFYPYSMEGLYRGSFLTHRSQYNPFLHMSETFLTLKEAAEKKEKNTPLNEKKIDKKDISLPIFTSSPIIKDQLEDKLNRLGISKDKGLIILNPGEGELPLREWPINNFIALSGMFLRETELSIILAGGKGGFKKADILCKNIKNNTRCVNFCGKTTLPELLELLNLSKLLISNDCGLAHIASLTSIKKILFFGPETPKIYAPLGNQQLIFYSGLPCSPCLSAFNHRHSFCKENKCLLLIEPRDVFALAKEKL